MSVQCNHCGHEEDIVEFTVRHGLISGDYECICCGMEIDGKSNR